MDLAALGYQGRSHPTTKLRANLLVPEGSRLHLVNFAIVKLVEPFGSLFECEILLQAQAWQRGGVAMLTPRFYRFSHAASAAPAK